MTIIYDACACVQCNMFIHYSRYFVTFIKENGVSVFMFMYHALHLCFLSFPLFLASLLFRFFLFPPLYIYALHFLGDVIFPGENAEYIKNE